MIYPIVVYGSPGLRKIAREIGPDYKELQLLIKEMYETMYVSDGIGLAAPQIGKSIRLFVIDAAPIADEDESLADFKKVFINPEIIEESGDKWTFTEGCLSLPNLREDVVRQTNVKLQYFDENFVEHIEEYDGIKARIIQHEYDHLDGILFIDKISPLKRKLIKGKLNDIAKGKASVSYKIKVVK